MAVIDQDNFSNISWHSDQNHPGGTSHPGPLDGQDPDSPDVKPSQPEGTNPVDNQSLDPGAGSEVLECTVSEPLTENAGTKDAYVSYLITTNVRTYLNAGTGTLANGRAFECTDNFHFRPPFRPSKSPSPPSAAASRTSSSFPKHSARIIQHALSRLCLTSSAWSTSAAIDSA